MGEVKDRSGIGWVFHNTQMTPSGNSAFSGAAYLASEELNWAKSSTLASAHFAGRPPVGDLKNVGKRNFSKKVGKSRPLGCTRSEAAEKRNCNTLGTVEYLGFFVP